MKRLDSMNTKKLMVPFLLATATMLAGCGRVAENEVMVAMNKGAFQDVVLKPELYCMPMCSPYTDRIYFKTFPDTFTISSGQGASVGGEQSQATQSRQIFLRSSDDKFIESVSLSITYEVVKTPNAEKLVTEFRADSTDAEQNALLIRDDLQILATQPMVNVIRSYEALDLQDKGAEIGTRLTEALQQAVDNRLEIKKGEQSPILIKTVVLGGVKFDPETEALLKRKIFAREQVAIAEEANKAAEFQVSAAESQAGVTAKVINVIKDTGTAPDQVASLVCLDLLRQKQIPESTACFPSLKVK